MQFNEESLFPTQQDSLIITAVPFGPATRVADTGHQTQFTSAQQVQIARHLAVMCCCVDQITVLCVVRLRCRILLPGP